MFISKSKRFMPWSTFGSEFERLNRHFNQVFGQAPAVSSMVPAFNVWANEEGAVVTTELPGVEMESLEISTSGSNLTVKGSKKEEQVEGGQIVRRERNSGEFSRTIELPFRIDAEKVEASLNNGVLKMTLPRAESDKPRKIEIRSI